MRLQVSRRRSMSRSPNGGQWGMDTLLPLSFSRPRVADLVDQLLVSSLLIDHAVLQHDGSGFDHPVTAGLLRFKARDCRIHHSGIPAHRRNRKALSPQSTKLGFKRPL